MASANWIDSQTRTPGSGILLQEYQSGLDPAGQQRRWPRLDCSTSALHGADAKPPFEQAEQTLSALLRASRKAREVLAPAAINVLEAIAQVDRRYQPGGSRCAQTSKEKETSETGMSLSQRAFDRQQTHTSPGTVFRIIPAA